MKAYYQDNWVTIFNADCRDVLPTLEAGSVDLVLTDPPYRYLKGSLSITFNSGVAARQHPAQTVGTPWATDLAGLSLAWDVCRYGLLTFCSFHSVDDIPALIGVPGLALVTWAQSNAMPPQNNVPHYCTEFIWAFKKSPGLDWRKLRTFYQYSRLQTGCIASPERYCTNGRAIHPTQKPLALMRALLAIGGDIILDPYMGTGTTLRAAKDLGRKAIGIEIEERYCEIAAKRMAQAPMIFEDVPKNEQLAMEVG